MSTRMLIDARHPEETRVAVVRNNRVEEYDYESVTKRQIKGNIYLAKVTRVEPSLQAAFVDFGGNRHGFLPFSEIHPDYYQIPVEDREALLREEQEEARADAESEEAEGDALAETTSDEAEEEVVSVGGEDEEDHRPRRALRPGALRRRYRIQEVIKRRQILLVQVAKEERGSKGAALTTYLSLPGRYCVLMPNSPRGGGISRKITNPKDRRQLKQILNTLDVPEGMGCIIRTAGLKRTKSEIKRDFEYLLRLWDEIRERTLNSLAPALIYEEGDLIKRAIRDLYTRDIEEVLVEGEQGYRTAKEFMGLLMPSHARRVKHYRDSIPLFQRYQVEQQLEAIHSPVVQLKSGGYLVFNPTEALVAIDVNSGRATREHHIEETALQTNLEAAEEIARQLRLRDLAGLIVIDFIDMENRQNIRTVERKLREALRSDRARIQLGRISSFGLLEMSRQRLRPNLVEASMIVCPRCAGAGVVRSMQSGALAVLRAIEQEGVRNRSESVRVEAPADVTHYLLNEKRAALADLESQYDLKITIEASQTLGAEPYRLERTPRSTPAQTKDEQPLSQSTSAETAVTASEENVGPPSDAESEAQKASSSSKRKSESSRRRTRRSRSKSAAREKTAASSVKAAEKTEDGKEEQLATSSSPQVARQDDAVSATMAAEATASESGDEPPAAAKPRRRRARRTRTGAAKSAQTPEAMTDAPPRPPESGSASATANVDRHEPQDETHSSSDEAAKEAASSSFRDAAEEAVPSEVVMPPAARAENKEAAESQETPQRDPQANEAAQASDSSEPAEKASARRRRRQATATGRTTRRRKTVSPSAAAETPAAAEKMETRDSASESRSTAWDATDTKAATSSDERPSESSAPPPPPPPSPPSPAPAPETGTAGEKVAQGGGEQESISQPTSTDDAESKRSTRRKKGWWQKALGGGL